MATPPVNGPARPPTTDVLCANGVQVLTGVKHFFGDDDIYEIVLEPDANMGTFFFTDHQTGTLLTRAPSPQR